MKLAASQQLYTYWRELKAARTAPERNDVDPSAIRGVLADTLILEFDPAAGYPVRIVGSRTNALFMRELRGEAFLDIWRAADRSETADILAAVADEAQPYLLGASGGPPGMDKVDVEILLLPLRHRGATHSRVLGSCAPRQSPRWLGLSPIGPIALTSLRALGRSDFENNSRPSLPAAPAPDFQRRGHLFVYSART